MPTKPKRPRYTRVGPPPENNIRRANGTPGWGKWGSFLKSCFEHPKTWLRSEPIRARHTAEQAASDLRHGRLVGHQPKITGSKKGRWEAEWGHDKDDLDLTHWFVWARWIPERASKK